MQNKPYHKQLEDIITNLSTTDKKQTLLLHACCGPCSSYVLEYLAKHFDITIFYYNPNIYPAAEYDRRLNELEKFLTVFPDAIKNSVKLVKWNYDPEDYFKSTNVMNEKTLQTEPEKGERCRRCYKFRMEAAYKYAINNSFDWMTTTLSISPHKDSDKINIIGIELEKSFSLNFPDKIITKFLPSNFKKNGGFLRSTQLSSEYGLWRQDYCGCIFSKINSEK